MKILVMGSGGREHALVWKLRQSPRVTKIYCAPGNGGIADEAECVPVDVKSLDSMVELANHIQPDLTVVGPELPLMLGVVDEFTRRGWRTFGPTRAAAHWKRARALPRNSCSATAFQRLIMRSAILLNRCATPCRTSTLRSS